MILFPGALRPAEGGPVRLGLDILRTRPRFGDLLTVFSHPVDVETDRFADGMLHCRNAFAGRDAARQVRHVGRPVPVGPLDDHRELLARYGAMRPLASGLLPSSYTITGDTTEMGRQNVIYSQLVERLESIGVTEDERNLRNKVSRGKFTAAFMLQCLVALGSHSLRLES